MQYLGLTTREFTAAKSAIFRDVIPSTLKPEEFEAIVMSSPNTVAMR